MRESPCTPTFVNDAVMTLTSEINKVHSLTMVKMPAKINEDAYSSLVFIVFTGLFSYMSNVTLTFDLQNQ